MLFTQYDDQGREIPDPRPMSLPSGWDRPLSLSEQIKRMVRVELSRQAVDDGQESFEEADDFDVEDEEAEFLSPYEVSEMAPEPLQGVDPDPPAAPLAGKPAEASKAVVEPSVKPSEVPE